MLSRTLLDLFYFLKKEYGTVIQYTKPGKGDIDPDTGRRDTSADRTFPLDSVLVPVGHTTEWLLKVLGKVERVTTVYLIRVQDIPAGITIETGDWFVHGNLKYKQPEFEDFGGTLIGLTGKTFT
jgi:hypothetical protein